MTSGILRKLEGGDRRSIGRADEVAAEVMDQPRLFDQVIRGMLVEDPLVRMRAADVAEKVSAVHPEYLAPHKSLLIDEASAIHQQEVRWHLAQMYPRLELSRSERYRVVDLLLGFLMDESRIVMTFSMEALARFAMEDEEIRPEITAIIENLVSTGSPSMQSRGRKLLKQLKPAKPAAGNPRQTAAEKDKVISDLKRIRNVGPAIAEKLYRVGVRSPGEILEGEPEAIYARLQEQYGPGLDRCVLYVLRGAKADKPWPQCSDKNLGIVPPRKGRR